jgi:DNA-binding transcriptional regulator YhcF (GntR family)
MEFRENQAIYLQIADLVSENVLNGAWKSLDRIPSIRELAESIEVNPNTVVRTYAYLQDQGIIHNQRGIGYFLTDRAFQITMELSRKGFVSRDLPRTFKTMDLLGMSFEDLKGLYNAHREKTKKEKTK